MSEADTDTRTRRSPALRAALARVAVVVPAEELERRRRTRYALLFGHDREPELLELPPSEADPDPLVRFCGALGRACGTVGLDRRRLRRAVELALREVGDAR